MPSLIPVAVCRSAEFLSGMARERESEAFRYGSERLLY